MSPITGASRSMCAHAVVGIWLDRGELDRLMGPAEPAVGTPVPSIGAGQPQPDRAARDDDGGGGSKKSSKKNKKRRLMDKLGDALEEVLDL